MRCALFVLTLAVTSIAPLTAQQAPWKGENLQYFPKDITRPELVQRMREFSSALGVECQHCHSGSDGKLNFSADDKAAKNFARAMVRMVDGLNADVLKDQGGVTCWTCHRGKAIPPRLPRADWEKVRADHAVEFENQPNRAIAMSVYAASLGVDCSHCHEADRALNTKAPKAMVARMLPIFDEIPKHFDKARMPVTQCYMCHHGKLKPERQPQ